MAHKKSEAKTPPNQGLRPALLELVDQVGESVHPGLWLDRFLKLQTWHNNEPKGYNKTSAIAAKDQLVAKVDQGTLASGYRIAYKQWEADLASEEMRCCVEVGRAKGRIVIGLGQKNPAEFGITLHRTWGVPILPGSALKGIASLGADRYFEDDSWRRRPTAAEARKNGPNAFDALFGDVEEQGAVIFHDAWLQPDSTKKNGLHRDVLTVHHPKYYQSGAEPSDTEDPIPVPFMSAKGSFLVAIELHPSLDPSQHGHWLEAAWECLRLGLEHHGIGSKTNAGYGRVALRSFAETKIGQAQQRAKEIAAQERETIAFLTSMASMAPDGRVDMYCQKYSPESLIGWLKSNGAQPAPGLVFDRAHVIAANQELFKREMARGLQRELTGQAHQWWISATQPNSPAGAQVKARKRIQQSQFDKLLKTCQKKNKTDWHRYSRQLLEMGPDNESIDRAIKMMTEGQAPEGPIDTLRAYKLS